MKRVAILGAGGHARSVAGVALGIQGWNIQAFVDIHAQGPAGDELVFGKPVVSAGPELLQTLKSLKVDSLLLAVGDNQARQSLFQTLKNHFEFPNLISPSAICKQEVEMGQANIILDQVYIGPLCRIGDNNLFNTRALLEHECRVGDANHMAPGSIVLGRSQLGNLNFLGAGAVVKQGVQVGDRAVIGAQSFVNGTLADGIFYGLPARQGKS